jgi:hypothetical protein
MTLVPELAAVLFAVAMATLVGAPVAMRAARRRRTLLRECLQCGRTLIFGSKTCDCPD